MAIALHVITIFAVAVNTGVNVAVLLRLRSMGEPTLHLMIGSPEFDPDDFAEPDALQPKAGVH